MTGRAFCPITPTANSRPSMYSSIKISSSHENASSRAISYSSCEWAIVTPMLEPPQQGFTMQEKKLAHLPRLCFSLVCSFFCRLALEYRL